MLKLKAKVFITDIKIANEFSEAFKDPVIFYLAHKEDKRSFFMTFAILDFSKKQLMYIKTFFPENVSLVERNPEEEKLRILFGRNNPHRSLEVKKGESFLTFIESCKYFYSVSLKERSVSIFTTNDISKVTDKKIEAICCTPQKENEFFYTTAVSTTEDIPKDLYFYKVSLDLSKYELIHTEKNFSGSAPHVTKKFGDYIFCSEFSRERLKYDGQIMSSTQYMNIVYRDLYKEFCGTKNMDFSEEDFISKNKIFMEDVHLESEFDEFVKSKGPNFLKICQDNKKYNFSAEPGLISVLNINSHELKYYNTSTCTPAHFEIDEENNAVYASSHNFVFLDKHYYLGPSLIDKFTIVEGELKKQKSFTTPDGFRFTTHKVFKNRNKSYICTFGHPTRLFFIDAETMEMVFFQDIEFENILPKEGNLTDFINLNNDKLNRISIKAIEVSDSGKYVLLLSYSYIYIYDFEQRCVVDKIRYTGDVWLDEHLNLIDFYRWTTHFDILK